MKGAGRQPSSPHGNKRPRKRANPEAPPAAGIAARSQAVSMLHAVIHDGRSLDDALAAAYSASELKQASHSDPRDRGFARLLVTTTLRRYGQLKDVVSSYIDKPLPRSGQRAELILLIGAAQMLCLASPAHAVINTAVQLSRQHRQSARFDKLINAVLRRISETGAERFAEMDPVSTNFPDWMLERWQAAYGSEAAREIATASLSEPALDLTIKDHAQALNQLRNQASNQPPNQILPQSSLQTWAEKVGGIVLPTGSVRRKNDGRIDLLAGFEEGAWLVQDAAAAIPARLFRDAAGARIADLCAAPGGKTAQLAAAGASVTAVDQSEERLKRVRTNLDRLGLAAELVTGDAATWSADTLFDGVLVDAPCTASGTIRRHPDIIHLKRPDDLAKLANVQQQILENAARIVRPGGTLVYCTCSLEPEEGEHRIASFLAQSPEFERVPLDPSEAGGDAALINPDGDLRTLPSHFRHDDPALCGLDGFFASRLRRRT